MKTAQGIVPPQEGSFSTHIIGKTTRRALESMRVFKDFGAYKTALEAMAWAIPGTRMREHGDPSAGDRGPVDGGGGTDSRETGRGCRSAGPRSESLAGPAP